ncbi:uncharacterized protein BYT42DRAFT_299116 [Radiomyces spectabilis]|uniref:uncharacterized protein n=1 Tax=Radiomyces spectabilis TaxID=64574 RepID=UPI002220E209|nr:uncharacterized protein BYT42DRAFT_299116 [Radiomyces spectabilis]KAI8381258.1 hypothetical protein BYT42DRAFT_299116 [Radiomyces spectabilis]
MADSAGPEPLRSEFYMDPNNLDKEFEKVPLFMNHLPEEENDTLSALQSLVYDGTPEEIAENFKNQGNDCFKAGKYKYQDAITFYTRAIDTDCADKKITEACLANRAAVNLELGNYGRVLRDCAKCLEMNPRHVKALYRSARALLALDRAQEAHDCCEHGLAVDPDNTALKAMKEKCIQRQEALEARQRRKEEKEKADREAKENLEKALKDRKIKIEVTDKEVREKASIVLDPETQTLSWPVFFLYPEYKESDYIQQFNETNTFMDHLEVMFEQPAPWDANHQYTPDNVEVYFENNQGLRPSLIKIGKKHPLGKILSLDQYVVTNGVPSFIILPKNSPFKDDFLKKYKK